MRVAGSRLLRWKRAHHRIALSRRAYRQHAAVEQGHSQHKGVKALIIHNVKDKGTEAGGREPEPEGSPYTQIYGGLVRLAAVLGAWGTRNPVSLTLHLLQRDFHGTLPGRVVGEEVLHFLKNAMRLWGMDALEAPGGRQRPGKLRA